MRSSNQAISLISEFEGFSSIKYLCPAGIPTIGYGHVILPGDPEKVTKQEALELLKKDLQSREGQLNKLGLNLTQNQFDALISFIYNVGFGRFLKSTMLKLLRQGNYELAANEFDRYVYSGSKILKGLVIRRSKEKSLFLEV